MTHPCPTGEVVLLRGGTEVARWALPASCADLGLVDALARLQLAAKRAGGRIELRGASEELLGLLRLVGLAAELVEMGGQAEGGEQVGVEEVVVTDDPVA